MASSLPEAKPNHVLFGRDAILDNVATNIARGQTLFALEGVTGIGKSALLTEISKRLENAGFCGVATLNAAQRTSEDLAITAIYQQLIDLVRDPGTLEQELKRRFESELGHTFRKVVGAISADLLTLVTEKAGNTVEVVKEIITGRDDVPNATAQLETLDSDSQRYVISEFLKTLADAGNSVVIAIDNFDSADPTLVSLVRFLIREKPEHIALIIGHNTEAVDNSNWDNVLADLRARGGQWLQLQSLDRTAIVAWFKSEIGRCPTHTELEQLECETHGRAQDLKLAIDWVKYGGVAPLHRDYGGYYDLGRQRLSSDARNVAELLAVINRDAQIAEEVLAAAAESLGVDNLGPALDELRGERLLKIEGGNLSLSHSLARDSWLETINSRRKERLGNAWFIAVRSFDITQLTAPEAAGLIPIIAKPLLENRSVAEIAEIGEQLIAVGQVRNGLNLIDQTWRFKASGSIGGADMLRNALLAARTRLDLGRYSEVDEPLTQADLAAGDDPVAKIQVLLLRMKLALRRNTYTVLPILAGQIGCLAAGDSKARGESELILNVACRDLMDLDALRASSVRLLALWDDSTPEQQNAIDRAVARSLAKLGDTGAALKHAEAAVKTSLGLGSIRIVGNANLAMAEVLRYRGDFEVAIAAYRDAAGIGRASGNRDSQLWSLLGQAAAHIGAGMPEDSTGPLMEIEALLAEPGYNHPLETVHASFLRVLAGTSDTTDDEIVERYEPFQIKWPSEYLVKFRKSIELAGPTPL